MTNNPTIDGVSRGLIEMTIDLLQDLRRGTAVERKLRALLDAPAVERQDEVAFLEMELEGERRAKLELADVLGVGGEPRWKWMLSAARAQQSTISRLEARITQLESEEPEWSAMQQRLGDENARLRDRIAELESGPGEPVAWSYCPECGCEEVHHEVGEHKQCANCHQEWFSDIDYSDVVHGNLQKLKAAPPAPAAVVLPDRKDLKLLKGGGYWKGVYHGWNACLDATAALNVVADGKARDV